MKLLLDRLSSLPPASPTTRPALMTHVVLGYPSLKESVELVKVMAENGADFIELQIPFSDPIADGPTIMAASEAALSQGITPTDCMRAMEQLSKTSCADSVHSRQDRQDAIWCNRSIGRDAKWNRGLAGTPRRTVAAATTPTRSCSNSVSDAGVPGTGSSTGAVNVFADRRRRPDVGRLPKLWPPGLPKSLRCSRRGPVSGWDLRRNLYRCA